MANSSKASRFKAESGRGGSGVVFKDVGLPSAADRWRECDRCYGLKPVEEYTRLGGKSYLCDSCWGEIDSKKAGQWAESVATRRRVEERLGLRSGTTRARMDASPAAKATLDRLLAAYEDGTLDPELAAEQCVEMPRDCGV